MLTATAAGLAGLAFALAWPVPVLLARARWPARDPVVALLCWQAVGLAGGLSLIGALLVHGLAPWGPSLPEAGWAVLSAGPAGGPVRGDHWVALTLAGVLAVELVGVLAHSWVRTARTRRRHRELLELVVRPAAAVPDARLLDHPAPVAFCIPGARPLLVLSSGMVAELDEAQLAAVVAHERAHLREHHHLYLLPFVAWEAALPVLPATTRAHTAVRTLVEMRADDLALADPALAGTGGPHPRRTLAEAIVAAAEGAGGVPGGALALGAGAVAARVHRLLDPPPPLPAAVRTAVLVVAALLLLLPTALLLLPAGL
ncbi:M56 family metallopeptidase [Geodermatophilus sp. YIM 151500]|uniref:M56 family metallopeptidase n=1 Tax=Geodermatophilus sp. YIM 151500 TaxID=2984531 RepID=UPI0021E450FA|nr:M56 family metallopeptidase [Geodermatophilus sp. YIM 151500]MCV2488131.1 M56 family metallopeptidase [Geodermatophilus sp. YIM 151500]